MRGMGDLGAAACSCGFWFALAQKLYPMPMPVTVGYYDTQTLLMVAAKSRQPGEVRLGCDLFDGQLEDSSSLAA